MIYYVLQYAYSFSSIHSIDPFVPLCYCHKRNAVAATQQFFLSIFVYVFVSLVQLELPIVHLGLRPKDYMLLHLLNRPQLQVTDPTVWCIWKRRGMVKLESKNP